MTHSSDEQCDASMDDLTEKRQRRRIRIGPRFALRTLLVGMVVLSGLLAIIAPWYRDHRKRRLLQAVDAQVFTEPRGQFFLRQFVGDSISQRSVCVHLDDPRVNDEWLKQIAGMEHAEVLSIKSAHVTDVGLLELRRWPSLISLALVDTQVTDAGIKKLRESMPNLRRIERYKSQDLK